MKRKTRKGEGQCKGGKRAKQAHGRTSLSAVVPIGMPLSWPVRVGALIPIRGGPPPPLGGSPLSAGTSPRVPRPAAKTVLSADTAPVRLDDDLQTVGYTHLAHNGGDVGLDGGVRNAHLARDLVVGPGPAQQAENLLLALGQIQVLR